MIHDVTSALAGLCQSVRLSCGADLVCLITFFEGGRGRSVASAPHRVFPAFRMTPPTGTTIGHIRSASETRLPTALIHAVGGPVAATLVLQPTPDCALLLLWRGTLPEAVKISHLPALMPAFAELRATQERAQRENEVHHQFEDLFSSVPSGILLINSDGSEALVNEHAAGLLGGKAGRQSTVDLSARMLRLRQRCDNREELERAYTGLISDPHFRSVMRWRLGPTTLEVDTHPLRGNGQQGRIWLFRDVTAEELMIDHLRRQAALDPLTEIPNRRHFEERSAQILAARDTAGTCLAVMMMDIDHFKKINDNFGHASGDQVLKEVARRARKTFRSHDLLARFGGEEFVALLSVGDDSEAIELAEAMRQSISDIEIIVNDSPLYVTISIGLAIGTSADRFSLEVLLRRADEALYRAKNTGRNCVNIASDLYETGST